MPKVFPPRLIRLQPTSLLEVVSRVLLKKNVPKQEIIVSIIAQNDKLVGMEQSDTNYDIIMTNTLQIADMLRKRSKVNESLTLMKWCISLCNKFTHPQLKMKEIRKCARAIWACALSIKKKNQILNPEVTLRVTSMLHLLLKIVRKTVAEDVKILALTEAWCSYFKAACFHYGSRNPDVQKCTQLSIALIKDIFHENYTQFRVVGLNHAISAASFEDTKGYRSAITAYQNAILAFKDAEDMSDLFRKSCVNHGKSKVLILQQQLFFSTLMVRK